MTTLSGETCSAMRDHRISLALAMATALVMGCGAPDPVAPDEFEDNGKSDGWGTPRPAGAPEAAGVDVERIDGWSDEALDIYFVPFNEVEDRIAYELQRARSDIRVAMYNLRSERLGQLLLDRHRDGLDVVLYLDARQMAKPWNTLDDDLIAQGLQVVPVLNGSSSYSTLHDKMAVIDGEVVIMGSANWGDSALFQNDETVMVLRSAPVAAVIDAELDELAAGLEIPRSGDMDSRVQLHFSPEDRLDHVIEDAIDAAEERILLAVFSFRLDWIAEALVEAHERGVEVVLITDRNQSTTTDTDEILSDAGITVLEVSNEASDYTAMHQKFAVIDGRTTLAGSYNWTYTATFYNNEDLLVIADDPEVAAAFEGEFGRLWQRYAPELPNPVEASVPLRVEAYCDRTVWGDAVVLVGDLPELGAWDPEQGLRLDGARFPLWTAELNLRAGAAFEYKLVLLRADGSVQWETGVNRRALAQTDPDEPPVELADAFRF